MQMSMVLRGRSRQALQPGTAVPAQQPGHAVWEQRHNRATSPQHTIRNHDAKQPHLASGCKSWHAAARLLLLLPVGGRHGCLAEAAAAGASSAGAAKPARRARAIGRGSVAARLRGAAWPPAVATGTAAGRSTVARAAGSAAGRSTVARAGSGAASRNTIARATGRSTVARAASLLAGSLCGRRGQGRRGMFTQPAAFRSWRHFKQAVCTATSTDAHTMQCSGAAPGRHSHHCSRRPQLPAWQRQRNH